MNKKQAGKAIEILERPHVCEFEVGCKDPARRLVAARLHSGPDGVAKARICDKHFSKLQVAPPFSMLSTLKVLPK